MEDQESAFYILCSELYYEKFSNAFIYWFISNVQFGNYAQTCSYACVSCGHLGRVKTDHGSSLKYVHSCQPLQLITPQSSHTQNNRGGNTFISLLREKSMGAQTASRSHLSEEHCYPYQMYPSHIPEQHEANYVQLLWGCWPLSAVAQTRYSLMQHKWCFNWVCYLTTPTIQLLLCGLLVVT